MFLISLGTNGQKKGMIKSLILYLWLGRYKTALFKGYLLSSQAVIDNFFSFAIGWAFKKKKKDNALIVQGFF